MRAFHPSYDRAGTGRSCAPCGDGRITSGHGRCDLVMAEQLCSSPVATPHIDSIVSATAGLVAPPLCALRRADTGTRSGTEALRSREVEGLGVVFRQRLDSSWFYLRPRQPPPGEGPSWNGSSPRGSTSLSKTSHVQASRQPSETTVESAHPVPSAQRGSSPPLQPCDGSRQSDPSERWQSRL